jgi:hypothetical protein
LRSASSSKVSWMSRLKVTVSLGSVVGIPKCSTSAALCQGGRGMIVEAFIT